jgi:hypothetical protein
LGAAASNGVLRPGAAQQHVQAWYDFALQGAQLVLDQAYAAYSALPVSTCRAAVFAVFAVPHDSC